MDKEISEPYSVTIVKFVGGFSNLTQLNLDLENNTSSEFMELLIEAATNQRISTLRLFAPSSYDPSKMGLITQDEGSIDDDHYEISSYYELFDPLRL